MEEQIGAGQTRQIDIWGIKLDEISQFRMQEIAPGTYDHGVAILLEEDGGYTTELDSVSGSVTVLESADEGESDGGSTASEDGESDGSESGSDELTRGFFSNDPNSSMAMLDDPAALTWVGILVSMVGIVAQLAWRQ